MALRHGAQSVSAIEYVPRLFASAQKSVANNLVNQVDREKLTLIHDNAITVAPERLAHPLADLLVAELLDAAGILNF